MTEFDNYLERQSGCDENPIECRNCGSDTIEDYECETCGSENTFEMETEPQDR